MKKIIFTFIVIMATIASSCTTGTGNQNAKPAEPITPMVLDKFETIVLQAPNTLDGVALLTAMQNRRSDREFEVKNLSLKHLSEIMWATNGVNRPDGKRTVPSAMARYPLLTYVVLENGIYLYQPEQHILVPVVEGDHRALAGRQPFVETAPLNVVLIADYQKYGERPMPADKRLYLAALDAGHCTQNIYLYCASEGLRNVVRAGAQEEELLKLLNLDENYQFVVAHTVGY